MPTPATLTREQIRVMPPGPAMDLLVSERVLGFAACEGAFSRLRPRYSSSIIMAWEVLQKVTCRKGWWFEISSQDGMDSGDLFFVCVHRGPETWWEAGSRHGDMKDSLPLAICRACLLTILET